MGTDQVQTGQGTGQVNFLQVKMVRSEQVIWNRSSWNRSSEVGKVNLSQDRQSPVKTGQVIRNRSNLVGAG